MHTCEELLLRAIWCQFHNEHVSMVTFYLVMLLQIFLTVSDIKYSKLTRIVFRVKA